MAWGPVDAAPRKDSWKKEIRRGPRPGETAPYTDEDLIRDRVMAGTFGTSVAIIGALGLVIVLALAFYAQYSGGLRWLLAIFVLALAAYLVARFVGTRVRDPRPLVPAAVTESRLPGELWSLSTTLDRAADGMKYSQVMFAARMKDAFLEKVRVSRGLSRDAIDRAKADPEALMSLVGDRDLVVFVLESERNGRHWPALLRYLPPRRAYREDSDRMLARMEAWR